ncbi:uncharacterized protein BDFB_004487, partial [Asbolus verrucosus]
RSVDPCDNFYQFTCGNFKEIHPRPNTANIVDHFTLLEEDLIKIGSEILLIPKLADDPVALKKAKSAYMSCLNVQYSNSNSLPELRTISEFEGMPLISSSNETVKFSWNEIGDLVGRYGVPLIFVYNIVQTNQNESLIMLSSDTFVNPTLFRPDYRQSYDDVVEEGFKEMARKRVARATTPAPFDIFLLTLAKKLLKYTNPGKPEEKVVEELNDMATFMRKMYAGGLMDGNILPLEDFPPTLGQLQNWTVSQFGDEIEMNWVEYFGKIFKMAGVEVSESTKLYHQGLEMIYGVLNLVRQTDPKIVKNFALLRVFLFQAPDSDYSTRKAFEDYYTAKGYKLYPRWEYCTRKILDVVDTATLSYAVTYGYQRYHYNINNIAQAAAMVQNIRDAFEEILATSDWLDDKSRDAALKKVNNMLILLAYPDFVEDRRKLDEFYKNLRICEWDNYGNARNMRAFKQAYQFTQLGALDRGFRLGSIIGHEITHGFDLNGKNYDQNGMQQSWWTQQTMDAFLARTECFKEQYSNYYIPEINATVNGSYCINENLADNGGVRESYRAFIKMLADQKITITGNYTAEQLFFIGYGTMWCSEESAYYLNVITNNKNGYPPNRFRVVGSLSNMEEFSAAFNCPVGNIPELDYLDTSADPCENFYQYTCGNFKNIHPRPDDEEVLDLITQTEEELVRIGNEILSSPKLPQDPEALKKAKSAYNTCVDVNYIDSLPAPELQLVDEFGGMPLISSDGIKKFSWSEIGEIVGKTGIHQMFSFTVKNFNPEDYVIIMSPDTWETPEMIRAKSRKTYDDVVEEGFKKKPSVKSSDPFDDFLWKIANNIMNWVEYVGNIFKWAGIEIDENQELYMIDFDSIYRILNLVHQTDADVVKNFVLLRTFMFLSPDTSAPNRQAFEEYYKSQGLRFYDRWEYCTRKMLDVVDSISLSFAVARHYKRYYFNNNKVHTSVNIIKSLKDSFRNIIATSDWVDKESRDAATEKVNNMVVSLAFPDFVEKKGRLDKFYQNVRICEWDNYGNSLRMRAFRQAYALTKLTDPDHWDYSPFEVNAYALRANNKICPNFDPFMIPISMLHDNILLGDNPVLDYSRLGTTIAHEMTHNFDSTGRTYNQSGFADRHWLSNGTIEALDERIQCLQDQYSSYYVPEIGKYVNGSTTLNENFADNGGIRKSFMSYQKHIRDKKIKNGSQKYTTEQLFFIGYATMWCSQESNEFLNNLVVHNSHAPSRVRILGTLSNFEEFSKAFSCPLGSNMNPEKKKLYASSLDGVTVSNQSCVKLIAEIHPRFDIVDHCTLLEKDLINIGTGNTNRMVYFSTLSCPDLPSKLDDLVALKKGKFASTSCFNV